jgi:hypothetical protein
LAKVGGWSARIAVLASLMAVGGCGWGDLARYDQEVRASWAALAAADRINVELAERLLTGRHGVLINQPKKAEELARASAQLRRLSEYRAIDLGDQADMARYGAARQQVAGSLENVAIALANRGNANRAWRSRSLRQQCEAAVMRAHSAMETYNAAAGAYNHALGTRQADVSKALLYPGSRQFALLEP